MAVLTATNFHFLLKSSWLFWL